MSGRGATAGRSTRCYRDFRSFKNLEPDEHGGFYLAGIESTLYHVDASGQVRAVLTHPSSGFGGLQLDGSDLYFADFAAPGTFSKLDTTTGESAVLAGFGGNGLLRLPGGDLLTTWVGTEGGTFERAHTLFA